MLENLITNMHKWLNGEPVPPFDEFNMRDYLHGLRDYLHGSINAQWADRVISATEIRREFIKEFGFCIPCREALDVCTSLAPLVEVGAGSGYWTKLLSVRGVDCIATDPAILYPVKQFNIPIGKFVVPRPLYGKTAVRQYPNRNVLMVWPNYNETWARQCAKAIRVGRTLITVTESYGGCCADDSFFGVLEQCFVQTNEIELPVFDGIHDRIEVWRKLRPWRMNCE